jgi:hypothetical protein
MLCILLKTIYYEFREDDFYKIRLKNSSYRVLTYQLWMVG